MPLPEPKSPWPPPQFERTTQDVMSWGAWWGGDLDELAAFYGGAVDQTRPGTSSLRSSIAGAVQRYFHGQRTASGEQRSKLHMPLAAEIAQVSADMLFGAPPNIGVRGDKGTQTRLEELLGEEAHVSLYDAAETCAALGMVYLRVGWDLDIDPTGPIISVVDADAAYPVFRQQRLAEVTFMSEWIDGSSYWRHLEHHAPGVIEHAVYLGTATNLGQRVMLSDFPDLAPLLDDMEILDDRRGIFETGVEMLDVVGVANARARTRAWRGTPQARDLGRADIAGEEPLLDALDDIYSSWSRDIRHGRSRLHVPQHYMKSLGPGKGAIVDADREVYVPLNAMVDTNGAMQIQAQQFAIRWQEHRESGIEFISRITSGAGYSPQTFGIAETTALTAAESWNRQIRTQNTRQAKVRRWRVAMRRLSALLIAMDRAHFNGTGDVEKARKSDVSFLESIAESMQQRATTAQLMRQAEAASTETLVKLLHPDWDDTQVRAECERIADDKPDPIPSPFEFGRGPNDADDDEDDQGTDDEPGDEPGEDDE